MRVAVTGAGGYVGRFLARHLTAQGHDVLRLSRTPDAALPDAAQVSFKLGTPVEPQTFAARGIDALVHAAYDFEPSKRDDVWRVNVEGSKRLFEAAVAGGVRRIVLLSSLSAFSGTPSNYGQAKLATEALLDPAHSTILRSGLIYGGDGGGMMGKISQQVESGRFIPVIDHRPSKLYLVHIEDLSRALEQMAASERTDEYVYLAGGLRGWSLGEIVLAVAQKRGRAVTLLPAPWQAVWAALRTAEMTGVSLAFKSDSVLSLTKVNAEAESPGRRWPGVQFREFPDGLERTL
jgi:nucleoside-diphosphate-sugar epimerase